MKTRIRPFGLVTLGLLAVLLVSPAFSQNCVDFDGISHCPVGDATLHSGARGLVVQNNGGMSGVSSRFAPTIHWTGKVRYTGGTDSRTALASISDGATTSRLFIDPEGDGFRARATFTGSSQDPTYSVLVYLDGVLQGALGSFDADPDGQGSLKALAASDAKLPEEKIAVYVDGIYWGELDPWRNWWIWDYYFFISPNGGCNWGMQMADPVAVVMPDGNTVQGNEIRFSEDVDGPGHYPYLGFESIETVTSSPRITVLDEFAEGTR